MIEASKTARQHAIYWPILTLLIRYEKWCSISVLLDETQLCRHLMTKITEFAKLEEYIVPCYQLVQQKKFKMLERFQPLATNAGRVVYDRKPTIWTDIAIALGLSAAFCTLIDSITSKDFEKCLLWEAHFRENIKDLVKCRPQFLIQNCSLTFLTRTKSAFEKMDASFVEKLPHVFYNFLLQICVILKPENRQFLNDCSTYGTDMYVCLEVFKAMRMHCDFAQLKFPTRVKFVSDGFEHGEEYIQKTREWERLASLWRLWNSVENVVDVVQTTPDKNVMHTSISNPSKPSLSSVCSSSSSTPSLVVTVLDGVIRRELEVVMADILRQTQPPIPFQCHLPREDSVQKWAKRIHITTFWNETK